MDLEGHPSGLGLSSRVEAPPGEKATPSGTAGIPAIEQHDVLALLEWRAAHGRSSALRPELRLMLCMLCDALETVISRVDDRHLPGAPQGISPAFRRRLIRDDYEWLMGVGTKGAALYSCESVCDFLGVDVAALRHALRCHGISRDALHQARGHLAEAASTHLTRVSARALRGQRRG